MSKKIVFVLFFIFLALVLAGCGTTSDDVEDAIRDYTYNYDSSASAFPEFSVGPEENIQEGEHLLSAINRVGCFSEGWVQWYHEGNLKVARIKMLTMLPEGSPFADVSVGDKLYCRPQGVPQVFLQGNNPSLAGVCGYEDVDNIRTLVCRLDLWEGGEKQEIVVYP